MQLSDVIRCFKVERKISETSYQCKCPVHYDNKASMTVSEKDGKILIHCHAGCSTEDIVSAVGITMKDLNVNSTAANDFGGKSWQTGLEAVYDYFDDNGKYVYSKLRYKGKKMFLGVIEKDYCRFKDIPKDKYLYNAEKARKSLADKPKEPVYIVEGEKDVDTLTMQGITAVTAGGASNWRKEFATFFKGAFVVILPDNDTPGKTLADKIVKDIKDICHSYKIVQTSSAEHGDVTDFLNEGNSKDDLLKLVEAEPWTIGASNNLEVKTLEEVEVKKVDWLVDGYMPLHQIITFGGDGGSAKTTLWSSILAAISSGRPTPFEELNAGLSYIDEPKRVMFFSSEDPAAEVLKPKMMKHGGNMKNIFFMDLTDDRFKNLRFGSQLLEDLIKKHRPAVVVFDPIQSFIDEKIQMGSRNAMRQCLNPLVGLCNKYGITIILIAHANKSTGTWGRKRLADSADLWDISRAVFLNGKLKNGLFYTSQEKNNYAPLAKTLLFDLEGGKLNPKGFTTKHDKDFIQEEQYVIKQAPAKEEAKNFILEILQEQGGEIENGELMEIAEVMSISANAIKNAKAELKKEQKITLKTEGKPGENRKNYISLLAI